MIGSQPKLSSATALDHRAAVVGANLGAIFVPQLDVPRPRRGLFTRAQISRLLQQAHIATHAETTF
jgi:hypothetical protein